MALWHRLESERGRSKFGPMTDVDGETLAAVIMALC